MHDYLIATASTADLQRPWLEEHGIPFISYQYTVNDEVFSDDCREESRAEAYKGMRAGNLLKTSMINEYAYIDFLSELLAGGKDVIFLDMSKKMSASYENCRSAAAKVREKFPDRRLYVMDTRCISGGLGVLVENMVRRMEAGADFDENIAWGEAHKLKIAHRFTVDDLKYLKMGGRVSNASALVGSLLNIKPVLHVDDDGHLIPMLKVRGRNASIKALAKKFTDTAIDPAHCTYFISNGDCPEDAKKLESIIIAEHGNHAALITDIGPVIGAHSGPGTLALFFVGTKR